MQNKAIFLDRDGIINEDTGYPHQISDIHFLPNLWATLHHLKKQHYKLIIVTNQSGIGRGIFSETNYQTLSNWLKQQFIMHHVPLTAIYHCPHVPKQNCNCRKPKPGMILNAAKQHHISLKHSWIIGDKESDIIAGINANIPQQIRLVSNPNVPSKASHLISSLSEITQIITQ